MDPQLIRTLLEDPKPDRLDIVEVAAALTRRGIDWRRWLRDRESSPHGGPDADLREDLDFLTWSVHSQRQADRITVGFAAIMNDLIAEIQHALFQDHPRLARELLVTIWQTYIAGTNENDDPTHSGVPRQPFPPTRTGRNAR